VQKIPGLLDEVHWLIENQRRLFVLCGSSARRCAARTQLLGGRALRYELFGFVSAELGAQFNLSRILNHGYLPATTWSTTPRPDPRVRAGLSEGGGVGRGLTRSLRCSRTSCMPPHSRTLAR